jgi:hypothetical protein
MVEPTVAFHVSIHNIEGKLILKIDVFPGSLKPYHLKNKGEIEGTYIRVGSTNRQADLETIEELGRQRMNISFDETSIIDATIEDIGDFLIFPGIRNCCIVFQPQSTQRAQSGAAFLCVLCALCGFSNQKIIKSLEFLLLSIYFPVFGYDPAKELGKIICRDHG